MRSQGQPTVNGAEVYDAEFEEDGGGGRSQALATVRGASAGMMQIRTQYTTAVVAQVPRVLSLTDAKGNEHPSSVLARVVREAAIAGEDFIYSMTFKSKDGPSIIEGVSIDGAMILARNYMNCATECEVVEEGPTHWIFKATFIDHETGFTEARLFRQNKMAAQMRGDAERKLDIAFQIGQSKAKRNAIVRAMPTWLVTKAIEAAKASAAAKIKDLPKAIEESRSAFESKFKVSLVRLEKYIGAPHASWNARDIVRLRSVYKAIVDRHTSVAAEFPVEEEPKPAEPKPEETLFGEPAPSTPTAASAPAARAEEKGDAKAAPTSSPPSPADPAKPKSDTKKPEKAKAAEPERDPVTGEIVPPPREPGEDG